MVNEITTGILGPLHLSQRTKSKPFTPLGLIDNFHPTWLASAGQARSTGVNGAWIPTFGHPLARAPTQKTIISCAEVAWNPARRTAWHARRAKLVIVLGGW